MRIWTGLCMVAVIGLIAAIPARAEISDFLGDWVATDSDPAGLARIVVTRSGGHDLTVQVFGKCAEKECDWGTKPGHVYTDGPGSSDIRRVTAEFALSNTKKHVTIRKTSGEGVRYDVLTDFGGGAGGADYVITGVLARPGVAAAPEAEGGSALGGFFADPYHDSGRATGEECDKFEPGGLYVSRSSGGWKLANFGETILKFGDEATARQAMSAIARYAFDEQCVISRDNPRMMYWKSKGTIPSADIAGASCTRFDPAKVAAMQSGGNWTVAVEGTTLIDYGSDHTSADKAVSIIKAYRLDRRCVAGDTRAAMQFWLSQ